MGLNEPLKDLGVSACGLGDPGPRTAQPIGHESPGLSPVRWGASTLG
jgi:hypothetical protein